MILLRRPGAVEIESFLRLQSSLGFTYADVGATRSGHPRGLVVDHNRVLLGHGEKAWDAAVAALERWEMFRISWLELCWPTAPIEVGTTVAVVVRGLGLWWVNPCRIVYRIDEKGPVERFGFAYGTLPDHAESGEERFSVEWNRDDDSVWYDVLAASRPRHVLVWLAFPLARILQKRFAGDSLAAMRRAADGELRGPA